MTLLSIIMPTYNGGKFIDAQLQSIIDQTHDNFELIVVDDGSSDETVEIVDATARRDSRVRRLPSVGNNGQRFRLVELVAATNGEFIAIADQDDFWHPERNEILLAAIGERAVAFGRSQLIDSEGRDLGKSILEASDIEPLHAGPLSTLFFPLLSAHAAIIRSSWLNRAAFFSAPPFDWVIGLEAMLSGGLAYEDSATVYHRIHGGNQMNGSIVKSDREKRMFSRSRLRKSTTFVETNRLDLITMLNQIGHSPVVDPKVRSAFKSAGDACRYAWFQYLSFEAFKNQALERRLHELLDPYAASPYDLAVFRRGVRSVTSGQYSPFNVRRGVGIYTGRSR